MDVDQHGGPWWAVPCAADLVLPALGLHAAGALTGAAASMFVVILAQSAATSRAYAAKYEEEFSEATDLVGLGAANAAAAFTGTFVVNGSPTKVQIVDSAGGRTQVSQLTAAAVVLVVLAALTGPLAYLPVSALAAVVFLIAVELIDLAGMRRILAVRKHEFVVALLTAAAVVGLGVEYGIVLAIVASIVDHLRHSYSPLNSVMVKSAEGHWRPVPVGPGARTEPGLVVYRFGTSLYYANAAKLAEDVNALAGHGAPLRWLILDFAAIGDVDYTASTVLTKVAEHLHRRQIRLVISSVLAPVRHQLDRYGVSVDACYDTPGEVPSFPAMLARFTTRPQPRSRMPGTKTRMVFTVPSTLMSRTRRHSSAVVSSNGLFAPTMPAELTSTSTGPIRLATSRSATSSVTSAVTSAGPLTSSVIAVRPSARSRAALAAPSPLAPPVTRAVRGMTATLPG